LVINGTKQAIKNSPAKLIYIVNLMTLNSQTNYFSALDHVQELEKYASRTLNYILVNNQLIPQSIKQAYQLEAEYPVIDDLAVDPRVIRKPLLANTLFQKPKSDQLKRSLLRHNPVTLAKTIISLIK